MSQQMSECVPKHISEQKCRNTCRTPFERKNESQQKQDNAGPSCKVRGKKQLIHKYNYQEAVYEHSAAKVYKRSDP